MNLSSGNTCIKSTVLIVIIDKIPCGNDIIFARKRKVSYTYDEHATVYISQDDFPRLHGIETGSICCLEHGDDNGFSIRVPVVARCLAMTRSVAETSIEETDQFHSSMNIRELIIKQDNAIPKVYVPPSIAATLGFHCLPIQNGCRHVVSIHPLKDQKIMGATRAVLREVGILPPIPRLDFRLNNNHEDSKVHQQKLDIEHEEKELRQFFLHPSKGKNHQSLYQPKRVTKPPKPRQRLLTLGSIISIPYSNTCGKDIAIQDARFYQVVDIQSKIQDIQDGPYGVIPFYVSPSTNLSLLPENLPNVDDNLVLHPQCPDLCIIPGYTWRLPRPSSAATFLQSIQDTLQADCEYNQPKKPLVVSKRINSIFTRCIRHPSAKEVADALFLQGVLPVRTENCLACQKSHTPYSMTKEPPMIHIIGGEDNHVRACVAEAADIMGMRCFHVDGLAAFWAHSNFLNIYSKSYGKPQDEKSRQALTGALPDKLRGLSASLEVACHSCPCVLHIAGIDLELSPIGRHGAAVDERRDEEQRILEAIREGFLKFLLPWRRPSLAIPTSKKFYDGNFRAYTTVPQVIIVFSSLGPLSPGPICKMLTCRSILLSSPDENYARFLWDGDIDGTFDSLSSMLVGLSAQEILFLRRNFVRRWNAGINNDSKNDRDRDRIMESKGLESSPVSILQSLFADLKAANSFRAPVPRVGISCAIPLSSTSLPDVRWEDIGGLSSIRKEIMDTVELPMKYPNLFEGCRRSGILLFGPPGTGKTLVAKAVARECGLPFISIKGPELLGSYVGESEANVRAVFEEARLAAMSSVRNTNTQHTTIECGSSHCQSGGSVLFFDELDSLAPRRGETAHGDGVMERVVATLLAELDNRTSSGKNNTTTISHQSNSSTPHIIVIGATNRPDLLDPALLRPGRFDRLLYLGPAKSKEACLQILMAQTRRFKFQCGCDREDILQEAMESFPSNLTGADLSSVASKALMHGLKRVTDKVEEEVQSTNLKMADNRSSGSVVDVEDVMESWNEEQLQPVMELNDFIQAAKDIVPSISVQDLEKFEKLKAQFSAV